MDGIIVKDTISASEVASHEYCELSWYYDLTGKKPPKKSEEKKKSRLQRGTEEHKKVDKRIKREKKKVSVGTWLILLSFLSLIIFIMWYLYF